MKILLLLTSFVIVSNVFATISIPRGEMEKKAAEEVATHTGFTESDSRYPSALTDCANNQASGGYKYFVKLNEYFTSEEFTSQSPELKEADIFEARIAIKMLCSEFIEAAGIEI